MESSHLGYPATRCAMPLPSFDSLLLPSLPPHFRPQHPVTLATYHPHASLSMVTSSSSPDPGNLGSLSALSQLATMSHLFPASLSASTPTPTSSPASLPPSASSAALPSSSTSLGTPSGEQKTPTPLWSSPLSATRNQVTPPSLPLSALAPSSSSFSSSFSCAALTSPPVLASSPSDLLIVPAPFSREDSSFRSTTGSPPDSPGSVEETDDTWNNFVVTAEKLYLASKSTWSSREEQLELHQKVCLALQQAITANAEVGKGLRALSHKAKESSRSPSKVIKPTSFSYFSELDFSTTTSSSSSSSPSSTGGRLVSIADLEFRKRKRRMSKAEPAICRSCNATSTPEWRKGPDGPRTLCNACGLHYAKLVKKPEEDEPK